MRILLLTDGLHPHVLGGMQKHSWYLARFLAQRGVEVYIMHGVPYGSPLVKEPEGFSAEEKEKIEHQCFHFPSPGKLPGHYIKESYRFSMELMRAWRALKRDFDFIYAQGFTGWAFMGAKDREKMPPIGVNFHGVEMFQKAASFRSRLEQKLLRGPVKYNLEQADLVFSLGGKLTSIQSEMAGPDKVIEIPIGVEESWLKSPEKPKEDRRRSFCFIGRYERRKGIEELNKAIKTLEADNHQADFHFIGPIPHSRRIQIKEGSQIDVSYHGKVMDQEKLQGILDECDVLVCPSWSEGMPTVIMEAMARGLAVIATDVGAVSKQVSDENGWLIEVGDQEALERSLKSAISISVDALYMKKNASYEKLKSNFLWPKVAAFTEQEIERFLAHQKTSAKSS